MELSQACLPSNQRRHSDLPSHSLLLSFPFRNNSPLSFSTARIITSPAAAAAAASSSSLRRLWRRGQGRDPSFSKQASHPFCAEWTELNSIATEDQFDEALAQARERCQPIIVNWTAAWCRKCIHLKPKLEKLATENKNVKFYSVDVNTVSQALVNRAEVTKMPTIQLWEDGKKQAEVIGGHQAWLVINEVREMLESY